MTRWALYWVISKKLDAYDMRAVVCNVPVGVDRAQVSAALARLGLVTEGPFLRLQPEAEWPPSVAAKAERIPPHDWASLSHNA